MPRQKITFEERVQVALDKDTGRQVDGKFGPEYMRVCNNDESIMFCPPALENAIQQSGAKAGDIVQIDRLKHGRAYEWEVAIVSEPPAQQPTRRPAASQPRTAAPQPATMPRAEITRDEVEMTAAFVAAIRAGAAAEQFAASEGIRDFRLNTGDIKSLAVTIFIARTKEATR